MACNVVLNAGLVTLWCRGEASYGTFGLEGVDKTYNVTQL